MGENKDFLPKQKSESKADFEARQTRAAAIKEEIYTRYYIKYLEDLKNRTLPTL